MLRTYTFIKGTVVVGLIAALTPALAVLWAQPLQQQQTLTPPVVTDTPPTAPAQGGLIWFNDQAEFEAYNVCEGKVFKGIENYEESVLPPNDIDGFDDPLESGVPNLPDGFPFPDGLTGLPNLIVQSNFEHNPDEPNPHGVNGLVTVSAPLFGAVSDVVVANSAVDSLDLIFTDEKSGVGFNTLIFAPQASVEVRAYSTTNVFLGMMTTLADPAGTNFIGVWSEEPIGRINIFHPGNAGEGADNIQAWEAGPASCPADLDGNGSVGATDLLELLVNWGPCP